MAEIKRKYFTTPIYYINAKPHIGHAYTTVAADILTRYYRDIKGEKVFFLTGTDEHGQKVEQAAAENNMTPKEHADAMVGNFRDLWEKLNISNCYYDEKSDKKECFIRTTHAKHKEVVQEILQRLFDKGEIQKRKYSGWYCVPDERFWTEKDLKDGNCPDCSRPVEHIEEENYFFLMSKYQQQLIDYINKEENRWFIEPAMRQNEVLGFLNNNKLDDLCISRPKSRLSWGIEIPFDKDYVTYVWFDALINYFSATKYLAPPIKDGDWWPATCHLIGKDILTTHSVYWLTMLLALGFEFPKKIFAHGWWMMEEEKMSKSLGNVVNPLDLVEEFGVDAFRFYLFRNSKFGKDASFSYEGFKKTYETELANDLGNLLSRVLSMIQKYGVEYQQNHIDSLGRGGFDSEKIDNAYEEIRFYDILEDIWAQVTAMNTQIEFDKPWVLAKSDRQKLANVLSTYFHWLRIIAGLLYPFMPETSLKMRQQMGIDSIPLKDLLNSDTIELSFDGINKGDPLFPKK